MESSARDAQIARKRGRPRREGIDEAALDAVVDLLVEGGLRAVTIEKVAAAIGTTRDALYRRWPNSAALIRDALESALMKGAGRSHRAAPYSTDGLALKEALVQMIKRMGQTFGAPRYRALYLGLIEAARAAPDLERTLEDHNALVLEGVVDALKSQPAFDGIPVETAARLILSSAAYPALLGRPSLDQGGIEEMAALMCAGFQRRSADQHS